MSWDNNDSYDGDEWRINRNTTPPKKNRKPKKAEKAVTITRKQLMQAFDNLTNRASIHSIAELLAKELGLEEGT